MDKKKRKGWWRKTHDFLLDSEMVNAELSWLQRIWYFVLLIASTVYVLCNFNVVVEFTFFSEFSGKNLIFIFWIILLIFPLIDNFEGFGIKYKRERQLVNKELNETTDNIMEASKQPENTTVDPNQIAEEFNNVIERKEESNEQ